MNGHFSANWWQQRYWCCGGLGHIQQNCPCGKGVDGSRRGLRENRCLAYTPTMRDSKGAMTRIKSKEPQLPAPRSRVTWRRINRKEMERELRSFSC